MPRAFVKPFDFSIELVIRTHPTLRSYCKQLECSEVDPSYHLYPSKKERLEPKDEIGLRNLKKDEDKELILEELKSHAEEYTNEKNKQERIKTYLKKTKGYDDQRVSNHKSYAKLRYNA